MPGNPCADASVSEDVRTLDAEIQAFEAMREACTKNIRELMAKEDPAAGVFYAAEIHAAQQEKLRLDVEIQFRRNKVSRLRFQGDSF